MTKKGADKGSASELKLIEPDDAKQQRLSRLFSDLGFAPQESKKPGTLIWRRTYVGEATTKIASVVAVVKMDALSGLVPEKIESFSVTIQTAIPGSREDVNAKAPTFCKEHLLKLLAIFDPVPHENLLEKETCSKCGKSSTEYTTAQEQTLCLDCLE